MAVAGGASSRPTIARPGELLRPSALARFWALNPKTVLDWMRGGRLVAIRSPGGHFRLRPGDVREFCARESLPVPPFARDDGTRIVLAGVTATERRAIDRALAGRRVTLEAFASAVEGVVSLACEPSPVVALNASSREIDAAAAIRALRRVPELAKGALIAFDAASASRAEGLVRAGATRALVKGGKTRLADVLVEIVP